MAYVPGDLNPMFPGALENQNNIWQYFNTAGDTEATIKGASFFSDAFNRRMHAGDIVVCYNIAGAVNSSAILQVNATAPTKAAPGATVAATVLIT